MMEELNPAQRWVWFGLLLMAGDSNEEGLIYKRKAANGELIGYSDKYISEHLDVDFRTFTKAKMSMLEHKKIGYIEQSCIKILNWEKYQSEYSRQKKYRNDDKSDKNNCNLLSNQSNTLDLDLDKEQEKDKEKNNMYEKDFEKLWKEYPIQGRFKKKICRDKFKALCKQGKLDEFKAATIGYANYLRMKKEYDNFDQRVMHLSTWMNNWEADKDRYIRFEYEPKL